MYARLNSSEVGDADLQPEQISDALLKLQKPASGEIQHAGHLADIGAFVVGLLLVSSKLMTLPVPYASTSPHAGSSSGQPKVIGPASTLKLVARDSSTIPLPESHPSAIPKGQHWVDLTDEGTVVVIEQPRGQSCAAMGGIMALRMKKRGVKGCVVDGRVRDLEELKNCGLPVSTR
jgi:regulator of RNase E activity RraA